MLFTAPFLPRNIWINCAEIFSPSGPPSPTKKKKTSLLSPFVFNSTSHIVPKRRIESVFTASKRNFFYPCSFFFLFLSFFSSFCWEKMLPSGGSRAVYLLKFLLLLSVQLFFYSYPSFFSFKFWEFLPRGEITEQYGGRVVYFLLRDAVTHSNGFSLFRQCTARNRGWWLLLCRCQFWSLVDWGDEREVGRTLMCRRETRIEDLMQTPSIISRINGGWVG